MLLKIFTNNFRATRKRGLSNFNTQILLERSETVSLFTLILCIEPGYLFSALQSDVTAGFHWNQKKNSCSSFLNWIFSLKLSFEVFWKKKLFSIFEIFSADVIFSLKQQFSKILLIFFSRSFWFLWHFYLPGGWVTDLSTNRLICFLIFL